MRLLESIGDAGPYAPVSQNGGYAAVLSLFLAAAGLFGVLSYIVAQRSGEIGIASRSALNESRCGEGCSRMGCAER